MDDVGARFSEHASLATETSRLLVPDAAESTDAAGVDAQDSGESWSPLVPLRSAGTRAPLIPARAPSYALGDAVLWHPFQLRSFETLLRTLTVPIAPTVALQGAAVYADLMQ